MQESVILQQMSRHFQMCHVVDFLKIHEKIWFQKAQLSMQKDNFFSM